MNTIASKISSSIPLAGLQDTGAVATKEQALASSAIDTKVCSGRGPLSGRQIAVGDGQATQALRRASATTQASSSPDLKVEMDDASPGIDSLKERKLSHGDGQTAARSAAAGAAILRLLSGISNLLKTILQAPLALFESTNPQQKSPQPSARALDSFHQQVSQLEGVLATDPLPPADASEEKILHPQAEKDWKREGLVLNGKTYPRGSVDMATVSKDLSAACGKPMAHWVSRYANQSGMEPVSQLIKTLPLGLDGETGFLPRGNEAPQHYTITVLEDKSVRIDVRCDWASMTSMTTADMDILELDKSSRIASSYSLLLTMPPSAAADAQPIVSILKPMELITDIRHSADQ